MCWASTWRTLGFDGCWMKLSRIGLARFSPAVRPEEDAAELGVQQAAVEGGVAVDVVGGDDREHRLQRRAGPEVGGGEQLVDPQVGGAERPHLAARMGELRRPADELRAVLALDRVEDAPRALRGAGPADVGDHVDVAALDEVGVVAGEPGELLAAGEARRRARALAVRRLGEDHREGAGRRPRRLARWSGSRRRREAPCRRTSSPGRSGAGRRRTSRAPAARPPPRRRGGADAQRRARSPQPKPRSPRAPCPHPGGIHTSARSAMRRSTSASRSAAEEGGRRAAAHEPADPRHPSSPPERARRNGCPTRRSAAAA